jgi:glycosyltransferase involved in cell wall biosynthesis
VIQSFSDSRIKYIKNETNSGIVFTLNKGLDAAKGEYIARMDGDDICLPQRFEKQIEYLLLNPEVSVLATLIKTIDENNSVLGYWNDDFNNVSPEQIAAFITRLNCIAHPTVMMRSSVVKKFKYQRFKNSEDWGLWLQLLSKRYKIAKLNSTLLLYRIHTNSLSNSHTNNHINRIISFKWNYLKSRILNLRLSSIELSVFLGLCKDIFKFKTPLLFTLFVKYKETRLIDLIQQYHSFKKTFTSTQIKKHKLYLFFPFYHIGGAEIVHSEIVKAAESKKPIVFFTSNSLPSYIFDVISNHSTVLKIDQLLVWPFLKKWTISKLVNTLRADSTIKLFSSNSKFYYTLLKYIPEHTIAIDLVHAFMHQHEPESSEKWSLPVVNKLKHRIVINEKTRKDFQELYIKNNINKKYLDSIRLIANFVETSPQTEKKYTENFNVLYVGRNTPEKRVPLIAQIAKEVAQFNSNIKFHFAGDVAASISNEYKEYCILHGEISDRNKLNAIYNDCHLLILASEREGFPLVIMEAMMNGLVTVSTNVGGISDHINDSNGILIEDNSAEELKKSFTNHILNLANDKVSWNKMSDNAYNYAKNNFSKEKFYQLYNELFS